MAVKRDSSLRAEVKVSLKQTWQLPARAPTVAHKHLLQLYKCGYFVGFTNKNV